MEFTEIFGMIVGCSALLALFVLLFYGVHSCEKTEEKKRNLMNEVTKYYHNRNKQFEEDNK